jgi:hypothetical protein
MATFTTTKSVASVQPRGDIDITSVTADFTIPAAFATSDIVQMVKVPAGAVIQEVILSSSAGVGATANLSLGDTGNTARYIASTAFTAATLARLGVHAGHGFRFTADGTIDVSAVSIATPTAGTVIRLTVIYTLGNN